MERHAQSTLHQALRPHCINTQVHMKFVVHTVLSRGWHSVGHIMPQQRSQQARRSRAHPPWQSPTRFPHSMLILISAAAAHPPWRAEFHRSGEGGHGINVRPAPRRRPKKLCAGTHGSQLRDINATCLTTQQLRWMHQFAGSRPWYVLCSDCTQAGHVWRVSHTDQSQHARVSNKYRRMSNEGQCRYYSFPSKFTCSSRGKGFAPRPRSTWYAPGPVGGNGVVGAV